MSDAGASDAGAAGTNDTGGTSTGEPGTTAGRIVVVAGAAGEAGVAVCAALTLAGAVVVAVGSRVEPLAGVEAAHRFVCDLGDADSVDELASAVRAEVGPVDGLIHLVGGWRAGSAEADWEFLEKRVLDTLRHTSRAFRDDLSASAAGRLAIVSSTSVDRPTWGNANYATAKAAAEAWVQALASGWRKAGTAAAVVFVVSSIGDTGTTPAEIGRRVAALWDDPATALNGARILLAD